MLLTLRDRTDVTNVRAAEQEQQMNWANSKPNRIAMETRKDSDDSIVTDDDIDLIDAPAVEIEDTGSVECNERAEEMKKEKQMPDVTVLTVSKYGVGSAMVDTHVNTEPKPVLRGEITTNTYLDVPSNINTSICNIPQAAEITSSSIAQRIGCLGC